MLIDILNLNFPKEVNGIVHIGQYNKEVNDKYLKNFKNLTESDIIWIENFKEYLHNFQITKKIEKIKINLFSNENKFNYLHISISDIELSILRGFEIIFNNIDYLYLVIDNIKIYENYSLLEDIDSQYNKLNYKRENIFINKDGYSDTFYVKEYFYIDSNYIKLLYGSNNIKKNITEIVFKTCLINNIIHIPCGDFPRANLFGDPDFGIKKLIYIESNNNNFIINHNDYCDIDLINKKIYINKLNFYQNKINNFNNKNINLNNYKIKYGIQNNSYSKIVDVTSIVFEKFKQGNFIYIPNKPKYLEFKLGCIIELPYKLLYIYDYDNQSIENIYEINLYQEILIDIKENKLYVDKIPNHLLEKIDINKFNNNIIRISNKNEFNFELDSNQNNIYKIENVIDYRYHYCEAIVDLEIKIKSSDSDIKSHYVILDCFAFDGFGHWIFESFIFFELIEKLNILYNNLKIVTTNKKNYVKNLLSFVNLNNEVIHKIDNENNICFIMPLISLNLLSINNIFDLNIFNKYIHKLIYKIDSICINLNFNNNNILYLPRNKKQNYNPTDKIPKKELSDRYNELVIEHITDCVIKDGGVILNTYDINNFFLQFSFLKSFKNIILDYGSSHMVNGIICKDKNIIILNPNNMNNHNQQLSNKIVLDLIKSKNKVTILNEFNNYEDIKKYLIFN